jgi:hypothetical protein
MKEEETRWCDHMAAPSATRHLVDAPPSSCSPALIFDRADGFSLHITLGYLSVYESPSYES